MNPTPDFPEKMPLYWLYGAEPPLYLAPMARYTDAPFRQLCKENGADVMVTEFVMCESLIRGNPTAWKAVEFTPEQRPLGVQIFGSDPERMALAARAVVDRLDPDFLDINCGCPADKITDQLAGSSLLKDPPHLQKIVAAVVRALPDKPVTVKIRIGWDAQSIVADEVGKRIEDAGARVLTIHGRTKAQGYSGEANWDVINRVAQSLHIPVIGNGNVSGPLDVGRLRASSPVKGFMIGRAALGYPWIFSEIKHHLKTGSFAPPPTLRERWHTLARYTELLVAHRTDKDVARGIGWMRAKLKALTKDMPDVKKLRPAIDTMKRLDELQAIAEWHLANHDPELRVRRSSTNNSSSEDEGSCTEDVQTP